MRQMVLVAYVIGDLPNISRRKNGIRQAVDLLLQKFNLPGQRVVVQNGTFFWGGHSGRSFVINLEPILKLFAFEHNTLFD
jgi:hypothetical protein